MQNVHGHLRRADSVCAICICTRHQEAVTGVIHSHNRKHVGNLNHGDVGNLNRGDVGNLNRGNRNNGMRNILISFLLWRRRTYKVPE